ncbi:hypothetical protein ACOME3_006783 [Neoechinorhynchus agilis]
MKYIQLYKFLTVITLPDIVKRLFAIIGKTDSITLRRQCELTLLSLCTDDNYENVEDFEWLISTMFRLCDQRQSTISDDTIEKAIAYTLVDIAVRVDEVRPFAEIEFVKLLRDPAKISGDILRAVSYILGAYGTRPESLDALLQCFKTRPIDGFTSSCVIQNCFKFSYRLNSIEWFRDQCEDFLAGGGFRQMKW